MKTKLIGIIVSALMITGILSIGGVSNTTSDELYIDNDEKIENTLLNDDWSMFQHGLKRTGYSTSTVPDTNGISWIAQSGGQIESKPSIVNGRVYVGSDDSNMYCIDVETGERIWEFLTDGPIRDGPAIYEGKVFFGSIDFNVYCLDATGNGDGTTNQIWSYETPPAENGIYSSPAVVNDRVFIGGQDGTLYCLDANGNGDGTTDLDANGNGDGTTDMIWSYSMGRITSSPAIDNGRVYIGSGDGNISCLDANGNGDGTTDMIWNYETGPSELGVQSSPAIAYDNIYIGSNDGNLYCLDAEGNGDGTTDMIWIHIIGIPGYCSPAVAYENIYIRSYQNGKMYCLDAIGNGDGTTDEIWSYITIPSILGSTSPAVADEKVIIGSGDRKVYCLDAQGNGDGTTDMIWNYQTSDAQHGILSSSAIADGKVFIGAFDGILYAFGVKAELEITNFTGGLGISFKVKNIGNTDATEVEWTFLVADGLFIVPRNSSDTIGTLGPDESTEIKISVFGIGMGILTEIPQIGLMISSYDAETVYKIENARIIGPIVIIQDEQ